jgi:FlaA1/EpsC-like NDP-sugar epimerase
MYDLQLIKLLQRSLDLLILIVSFVTAYLLRFDFNIPQNQFHNLTLQLPYVIALELTALHIFGCQKFSWRYVKLADVQAFFMAAISAAIPMALLRLMLPNSLGEFRIPHSVIVINMLIGYCGILGVRVICRALDEAHTRVKPEAPQPGIQIDRNGNRTAEIIPSRELYQPAEAEMKQFLTGKTVMVTGAGGSIGAELARQVARFQPASLLLVERAECSLLSIDRELRDLSPEIALVPLLADICDIRRMWTIFNLFNPQVVLHAAAHKHIKMMEFNLIEAVKNNSLATFHLGELAGTCGVETFVLISTDKAFRPKSVMGASKRIAELAVQCLNQRSYSRYVSVRFGNVAGSSIPEAAQLALQAGAMGDGGEIFILDLGEVDEPCESEDSGTKTNHPMIRRGKMAAYSPEKMHHALQQLTEMAQAGQERELRKYLNDLLPEARLEPREAQIQLGDHRWIALMSE